MKKRIVFLVITVLLLFISSASAKSIAFSLGKGALAEYWWGVPTEFRIHCIRPVFTKGVLWGFSAGCGYWDGGSEYYDFDGVEKRDGFRIGIPLETELLVSKNLTQDGDLSVFMGAGCGFYYYKEKNESTEDYYYLNNEVTILGAALYFTGGTSMIVTDRISIFTQFKSMGVGIFREKEEFDEVTITNSFMPGVDINDIGISMGIVYKIN
ncbi:MAG: hypothetical protein H8E46_02920 [FCB group bacterium]|nr:hypothetical protein [FCB group bacterium]